MLLVYLILAYLAIVWIGLRIVTPHMGFKREPLPDSIPGELSRLIERFDAEATDNVAFLKAAYTYITTSYQGSRIKTVTHFLNAFTDPLNQKSGFMVCSGQNYLLRLMLIKSGRFKESDVKVRVTPLNLFIHQYLQVRVNNSWVDVDPWSAFLGVPLGKKSTILG